VSRTSLLIVRTAGCFTLVRTSPSGYCTTWPSRTEIPGHACERMFQHTARCWSRCCHREAPDLYRGRGDRPSQTTRL